MTPTEIITLVGKEFSAVPPEEVGNWLEISKHLLSKEKFG